jgi:hypothetical protein
MSTNHTWRDAEAQLRDAQANAIERALYGLEGIEGMFDDRRELRAACAAARDLLRFEEENLRLRVERLSALAGQVQT